MSGISPTNFLFGRGPVQVSGDGDRSQEVVIRHLCRSAPVVDDIRNLNRFIRHIDDDGLR